MRDESAGMAALVARSRAVSIIGQMLRLSEHREVAIFLRDGDVGIADFIDGQGELVEVATWLRFNCGSPANAYAWRRLAIESAKPLSIAIIARIELLHHPAISRRSVDPASATRAPRGCAAWPTVPSTKFAEEASGTAIQCCFRGLDMAAGCPATHRSFQVTASGSRTREEGQRNDVSSPHQLR